MREIKFRAYVVGIQGCWMAIQGSHREIYTPAKFLALYGDDILMQYTGLQDKNGVEIYEGDIVRATLMSGDVYSRLLLVRFERGCFIIDGYELHIYDGLEVTGNIYENPELLAEAK